VPAAALALLLLAAPARAQLGPALAGRSAQADNAVTVNQNPAGITRLPSWQLVVDGILAISDNKFDVDEDQTSTSGGNPKNDRDIIGVPQFAFAMPVGDRFGPIAERFGFGFSIPQGYGTDYGSSWAGRYFAQESSLVFVSAQPVIAARVTDWLSVGAGAAIMYVSSETKVAVNNLEPGADDGRLKVDVDGVSVGPVVSALFEPLPDLRFGLSWRGEIEPELDGRPKFTDLGPGLEFALDTAGVLDEKIDINMRVPQSVQVGFYYRPFGRLALMGDLTWVDWSRFGTVDIEVGNNSTTAKTNYDDIWIGSAGAEYDFTEHWRGSLGFTYVSSAISSDDRGLALPLDEFYIFGIGAFGQLTDRLGVQTNLLAVFGGAGKVDQQGALTGRLVGEFDRRQTFALQIAFVWGEPAGSRHR
jgi:long-chain fatty acid transport protein